MKNTLKKHIDENDIEHYLLTCDLMEYDFKTIYKTFDISYFTKDKDLINNNFADSQMLKDYESIEKSTDNLIVILIKKFKLRLSFRKSSDFSNHIFICDDCDFDSTVLKDDAIKIAIVKDNWNKLENLMNYDYIFTLKENVKELGDYGTVFPIVDEPVFNQIKFILNDLFRLKSNKFYHFVNDVNFQRVFPKINGYFKILNSDYFNDQWYRDTYDFEDNTDSVIHYLLIGYEKNYDPSPDFSTEEYYECNKDVKKHGMNPLLHYERYGRNENRYISIEQKNERDYGLILNSSYFDREWYEHTYDIADDVDSVDHYLHVGYIKRYNPGPDFSTQEYFDCNRDVKKVLDNPLVHYELTGKKENRKTHFSDKRHKEDYDLILNSPYFDKDWYESNYDLSGFDDSVYHYLNIGYAKGYNPGPDFSTNEYFESNRDVEKHGMNPLLHYEKYGRNENRPISLEQRDERDYDLILNSPYFDREWYEHTYDIAEGVDSVDHYLHVGYIKRYNPGPDFSTQEYFDRNRDVKKVLDNPLVHYELRGRKEKRKIHFSNRRHQNDYNMILESPYFDKDWYESNYDLSGFDDSVYHYLNIGYTKGYNPGPDFSTDEYYECHPDVREHGMNPLLHYERYGRQEGRKISLKNNDS